MARIFNIYFSFDDELYSAIVSVRTTPFFTEYILGNLDEELREQLPSSRIISQEGTALFFQHTSSLHSKALMNAIIHSVAAYIRAGNISSEA